MKKKTNQKIRGQKKRKPGNKKFSQALIGGAFIASGCGCFAYPNFREWNTCLLYTSVLHKQRKNIAGMGTISAVVACMIISLLL